MRWWNNKTLSASLTVFIVKFAYLKLNYTNSTPIMTSKREYSVIGICKLKKVHIVLLWLLNMKITHPKVRKTMLVHWKIKKKKTKKKHLLFWSSRWASAETTARTQTWGKSSAVLIVYSCWPRWGKNKSWHHEEDERESLHSFRIIHLAHARSTVTCLQISKRTHHILFV